MNLSGLAGKAALDAIDATLGTPVGADFSADVAAVKAAVDVIDGIVDDVLAETVGVSSVYPTLAAAVQATAGAAWTLSAGFAELVPDATIASAYRVEGFHVEAKSSAEPYEVVVYSGLAAAEVEICRFRAISTGFYPVKADELPANTRLSFKVAHAFGAGTLALALQYH